MKINLNLKEKKITIWKGNGSVQYSTKGINFKNVSKEEIEELRETHDLIFILKLEDEFYYVPLPCPELSKLLSHSVFERNVCSYGNEECERKKDMTCNRLLAASDVNGGCAMVRDIFRSCYRGNDITVAEKQIEKYDFIKYGFQYCGYASESLIVIECRNYETPDEKPKLEIKQISRLKRSLREFALEI